MKISVLTPDKKVFEGNIVSVKVPGTHGEFQVLQNHAPIVSSLEKGKVEIVTAQGSHEYYDDETGSIKTADDPGKKMTFSISKGFIEVLDNDVSLLVEDITF